MADRASRFVDAMIVLRVRVQSLDPDTVIGMKLDGLASPTMNEHERNLAALFEGMDEITVREFLIAAIRKVRANPVNRPSTEKKGSHHDSARAVADASRERQCAERSRITVRLPH